MQPTFYLWVHYEIYPDLPVIRKWLTIQNLTDSAFFVEDVVIESLPLFADAERQSSNLAVWDFGGSRGAAARHLGKGDIGCLYFGR